MTDVNNFVPSKEQYEILKDVLGYGAEIIGLVFPKFPEAIAAKRVENLISIVKLVQKKLDEADLKPEERNAISLKLGLPIIEKSSLEDVPSLQELWANLLTNALNPKHSEEVRTIFIDIIQNLSSFDALILNAFNISRHPLVPKPLNQTMVKTNEGYKEFPTKKVEDSLTVLKSLGLLTDVTISEDVFLGNTGIVHGDETHLTPLGILFTNACVKDASK